VLLLLQTFKFLLKKSVHSFRNNQLKKIIRDYLTIIVECSML
jgi:hypothetical protein